MENDSSTQNCPVCNISVDPDKQYCDICGYDFTSGVKAAGPIEFKLPNISDEYKKTTKKDSFTPYLLILLVGILAAILLAPVSLFLEIGGLLLLGSCMGLLGVIYLFLSNAITPVGMGLLISFFISKITYRYKLRNKKAVSFLAGIIGGIGGLAYIGSWVVYGLFIRKSSAGFGFLDYLIWFWHFIALIITCALASVDNIQSHQICSNCHEYLDKRILAKIHVKNENAILASLEQRDFKALSEYPLETNLKNYIHIEFLSCDQCNSPDGYISARTVKWRKHYDHQGKESDISRLNQFYFSPLKVEEVSIISSIFDQSENQRIAK